MELVCSAGWLDTRSSLCMCVCASCTQTWYAALVQSKKLRWDFSDLFVLHCTTYMRSRSILFFIVLCARLGNAHWNNNKCVACADGEENASKGASSFSQPLRAEWYNKIKIGEKVRESLKATLDPSLEAILHTFGLTVDDYCLCAPLLVDGKPNY